MAEMAATPETTATAATAAKSDMAATAATSAGCKSLTCFDQLGYIFRYVVE